MRPQIRALAWPWGKFEKKRPQGLDIFFYSDILLCKFLNPAECGVFLFLTVFSPKRLGEDFLSPRTPCCPPADTRSGHDVISLKRPSLWSILHNGFY
jgi:hypothetical protein